MVVLFVPHVVGVSVDKQFLVELASTPEQWTKGLSGRTNLPENQGLLFIYPSSEPRAFWMKGMVFSIDIVFIDDSGAVARIEKNAAPMRPGEEKKLYHSGVPIKYALELNAGESDGIESGNLCNIKFNNEISRYILTVN